jgi:hypothetical protein
VTDRPSADKESGRSATVETGVSGGERALTRNSKLAAEGVMMVTSCAVDALCMAPGPMDAKETLPTRTFHATVLDYCLKPSVSSGSGRWVGTLTMAQRT